MQDRGLRGTTEWTRYEIALDVPAETTGINFGVLLTGRGTAWFDGLEVLVDGEPYRQVTPEVFVPGEAEVAALRSLAAPLATSDPEAPLDDLAPFGEWVGDASIVGLGEGTHGTREFFRMKHRLVRYLVERQGFTVFAIEANLPEAERVNRYVLAGEGDPAEALEGLGFWTWNTEEVLELIEWMRRYNASGRGRVEFWGFDMQTPDVAFETVERFLAEVDPEAREALEEELGDVRAAIEDRNASAGQGCRPSALVHRLMARSAGRLLERLESHRGAYAEKAGAEAVERAIGHARVVLQAAQSELPGGPSRDESMADNVDWILARHPPDTKVVLWAHNGHVSRDADGGPFRPMGSF